MAVVVMPAAALQAGTRVVQAVPVQPVVFDGRSVYADGNTNVLYVDTTPAEMAAGMGPRRRIGAGVPRGLVFGEPPKPHRKQKKERKRRPLRPRNIFGKTKPKKSNRARWAQDRGVNPLAELLELRPAAEPRIHTDPSAIEALRDLWGPGIDAEIVAAQNATLQFANGAANQIGVTAYNGTGNATGGAIYAGYVTDFAANTSVTINQTTIPNVTSYSTGGGTTIRATQILPVGPVTMNPARFSLEAAQDMQALYGMGDYQPFNLPQAIPEIDLVMSNKINPETLELTPVFKLIVRDPAGWTQENLQRAMMMTTRFPTGCEVIYADPVGLTSPAANYQSAEPLDPELARKREEFIAQREAKLARERAEQERRQAELLKKQETAKSRALGLLLRFMTPQQREEYTKKKFFHVVTRKRHRYRISHGHAGNIQRADGRRDVGAEASPRRKRGDVPQDREPQACEASHADHRRGR